MARIVSVGEPVNDAERKAIAYLRDELPAEYTVIHNFEIADGDARHEIDIAVLAPHAVYLIDVKGTQGRIEVYGSRWYPEGRDGYLSPLAKLNQHARVVKGLLVRASPGSAMSNIHVQATILLTDPGAMLTDPGGRDAPLTKPLSGCETYFRSDACVPGHRDNRISQLLPLVERELAGRAPRAERRRYGSWEVTETLGGDERTEEYAVRHAFVGHGSLTARLRLYRFDPMSPQPEREKEKRRLRNGFNSLARVPGHANIVGVRDLIEPEDEAGVLAYVMDEPRGRSLRVMLGESGEANSLTFDQKIRTVRDALTALAFIHRHRVIHRNLTPDAILVAEDGTARLTGFDFSRVADPVPGVVRESTVGSEIAEQLEAFYRAPEWDDNPSAADERGDLFSLGLLAYELFVGKKPFSDAAALRQAKEDGADAAMQSLPSADRPDLPPSIDRWLESLLAFDRAKRPVSAEDALRQFDAALAPAALNPAASPPLFPAPDSDLRNLPRAYALTEKLRVVKKLGDGKFGVAYECYDLFTDDRGVVKITLYDRKDIKERFLREYRTLHALPPHPYIVRTLWGDILPTGQPYLLFSFVEGNDVEKLSRSQALTPGEAKQLITQCAVGLEHLHKNGVYHQDIKPSNLLWTAEGARIIDFNVAVRDEEENGWLGGTPAYFPPDFDRGREPDADEKADRDLYALAITFYECLTGGEYPWPGHQTPPKTEEPKDPRQVLMRRSATNNAFGLSDELSGFFRTALAPRRAQRFPSADVFRTALEGLAVVLKAPTLRPLIPLPVIPSARPNENPFVPLLQTLFSQNPRTNAGTRGLDQIGEWTYVQTRLDETLLPDLQAGVFALAIISGNAGDGKTAFLQQWERSLVAAGATIKERRPNGTRLSLGEGADARTFVTNYDGSQDEGESDNEAVLLQFFAPFAGTDEGGWPTHETRVIAINEGRLADFLHGKEAQFAQLTRRVREGLSGVDTSSESSQAAVINLNLRSLVGESPEAGGNDDTPPSLFRRTLQKFLEPSFWQPCESCDLRDRCYVYHNARTLQDSLSGSRVIGRLETLYTLTHLRARLHLTVRDLRSALAFLLVGVRDCAEIHALYNEGTEVSRRKILDGFYFNSWRGGSEGTQDRLLSLLNEIDMGPVTNPEIDRRLGHYGPEERPADRLSFPNRPAPGYEAALMERKYAGLLTDMSSGARAERGRQHREYVGMARRRFYFERRDDREQEMLPYRYAADFEGLLKGQARLEETLPTLLDAINRGEGAASVVPDGSGVALRVRRVERGTIQTFRRFPADGFRAHLSQAPASLRRYLETLSEGFVLTYLSPETGQAQATLRVNLDIFEMLSRLGDGYRPSIEEAEGFYLSLGIFKNALAAAPYREALLTENGRQFYRITVESPDVLRLEKAVTVAGEPTTWL